MKEVNNQEEFEEELRKGTVEFIIEGFVAVLRDKSRAYLYDKSRAVLRDKSRADLHGESSAVLYGESSAYLHNKSSADLYGESRAVLHDKSRAYLRDKSSAVLRDKSSADLYDKSSAVLLDFSVGYVYSDDVKTENGSKATVIYPSYPSDMKEWCQLKRIPIINNKIKLWKATNLEGKDFYSGTVLYDTHQEIVCPDWSENYTGECGYGLHLADSPSSARRFVGKGFVDGFRLFQVEVDINDCVCTSGNPSYPMKIRAKKCRMVKEYPNDLLFFEEEEEERE